MQLIVCCGRVTKQLVKFLSGHWPPTEAERSQRSADRLIVRRDAVLYEFVCPSTEQLIESTRAHAASAGKEWEQKLPTLELSRRAAFSILERLQKIVVCLLCSDWIAFTENCVRACMNMMSYW